MYDKFHTTYIILPRFWKMKNNYMKKITFYLYEDILVMQQ